ncbi:MAG: hypothetical protein IJ681_06910 [Bacteroidales bacterium]|nr:hypothetical protein [Bacteroidales bacterium]
MNTFNFDGTMQFLRRHFKFLCVTFIVSGVVAGALSLLLPNYYKSEVLLLPSEFNSMSKALTNPGDKRDVFQYGTEKESEYILELLSSWQIIEKTAIKFNLREHYGLKNTPLDNEKMLLKLKKNIKVKRSDYLGAKLSVWDKNPEYACNIANYMVEELQVLRQRMKQAKADSVLKYMQISRDSMRVDVIRLTDSLHKLQVENNLYYPHSFADRFAQQMAKDVAAGNNAAVSRLEKKMAEVNEQSALMAALLNDIENKSKSMQAWEEYYQQAVLDFQSNIPVDFVAQYATISYKKDKPKRTVIVILAALACTLIAAEYLVVKEKYFSSETEDGQSNKA